MSALTDGNHRTIEYLRLSVTDKCNLRCIYCMPEEGVCSLAHSEILTFEETVRIVRILVSMGLKKVRLTGGEPFVRRGVMTLMEQLTAVPGIEEIAVTTNGLLLAPHLETLRALGVRKLNISIDTLDRTEYRRLTGFDGLETVHSAIEHAIVMGFDVKLNCVALDGVQDDLRLAELARSEPIAVRYIELMPVGMGKRCRGVPSDVILKALCRRYGAASVLPQEEQYNGPAAYYQFHGFQGKIGFISPVSHKFCDRCNRIRLTADGFLKLCLHYDTGLDLKALLRGGADDASIAAEIEKALLQKPQAHGFDSPDESADARHMYQIGG